MFKSLSKLCSRISPLNQMFFELNFSNGATRCSCPLRASPSQRRIVNNPFRSEFQYKVGRCNNLVVHGYFRVVVVDSYSFDSALGSQPKNICTFPQLQKTAYLTLVKSRLALGSPGCSFVCLFVTMLKMAQYTGKWMCTAP